MSRGGRGENERGTACDQGDLGEVPATKIGMGKEKRTHPDHQKMWSSRKVPFTEEVRIKGNEGDKSANTGCGD